MKVKLKKKLIIDGVPRAAGSIVDTAAGQSLIDSELATVATEKDTDDGK